MHHSLQACARQAFPALLGQILVGSWSSFFMFRRPLFVLFGDAFEVNQAPPKSQCRPGPRAREDLLLASVLAPLAVTELDAPVHADVFAMDASPSWGAVGASTVEPALAEALWDLGERRGHYSKLEAPARAVRRSCGLLCRLR